MTRPRVSDLTQSKLAVFRLDTLANMVTAAGLRMARVEGQRARLAQA